MCKYQICAVCSKEFEIAEENPYQRICDPCEIAAEVYYEERKDEELMYHAAVPEDLEAR